MLQVLHLNISKVDRVLHLPHRLLLPHLSVSSSPSPALHPSHYGEDALGWRRGCERALSPSRLREQGKDTASLFYYYEPSKIGFPLVGRDANLQLVESFGW
jgi:hypothetical protein